MTTLGLLKTSRDGLQRWKATVETRFLLPTALVGKLLQSVVSVRTLLRPTNQLTFDLDFFARAWVMTIARRKLKVKDKIKSPGLWLSGIVTRSVWLQSSIDGS